MAPPPLPTTTDPDKYKLVFENERVRVYDYTDKPGDKTQLHHHDAFVLHALSPFKRRLIFENGESVIREFKGGETFWSEVQNHIGENIGDTETHVLIVELKGGETMTSRLNPYLHFKDNAREAMEFYKTVFGGNLVLNTFGESHASQDPSEDNKIMHAMLEADNGITFMAADTPPGMEYHPGANISISLSGDDEEELRGYWEKLSEGATVTVPLEKAPWGDTFGMLTDKFGIGWMVNITGKKE